MSTVEALLSLSPHSLSLSSDMDGSWRLIGVERRRGILEAR